MMSFLQNPNQRVADPGSSDYIKFPALLAPTLALPRKQGREQSPFHRLAGEKVGMGGQRQIV